MKRRLCLLLVLGSCFLAAPGPGQSDEKILIPPPAAQLPAEPLSRENVPPLGERVTGWNRPADPPRKGGLVEELIDVLDKTHSADAFLVTLKLLEKLGTPAVSAIPAIVRNAERLGLFKDHLHAKDRDSELVNEIARSIEQLRHETAEPPMVKPASWESSTPIVSPPFTCKLQPRAGQRAIKIVLDCYVADRVLDDLGLLRAEDIAYHLRKQIEARFAGKTNRASESPTEVSVVPIRQVEKQRAEMTTDELGPDAQTLARHFKADYAVCLYIRSGHLAPKKAGVASGGVNVLLQVIDIRTPDEDPVHEEEMDLEHTANTREMGPFLRELIDRTTREAVSRLKVQ